MTETRLLERGAELDILAGVVASASAGRGRALLIEGEAGAGKSALLDAVADDDRLIARGAELERRYPFGIARQLLRGLESRHATDLPTAPPALHGLLRGGQPAGDQLAVILAMTGLVASIASERPLVICVDDAHWADATSLRWMTHLVRHLEELPVALVLAARPSEPGGFAELREIGAHPAVARVNLQPLSRAAVAQLVRDRLPEASDELASACAAATGGNPFLTVSLLDGVAALGLPDEATIARVASMAPAKVVDAIAVRIARLGDPASRLAAAVAVLERARLSTAAELAGLPLAEGAQAADRLRASRLLVGERAVGFAHPLVREAVYRDLPPGQRAEQHRAAARVLARLGEPAERVAAHLVLTDPAEDPDVARRLAAAAGEAMDRGAPEVAVTLLARANEEPPAETDRWQLSLAQLHAEDAAGRSPAELFARMRELIERAPTPVDAAHAILESQVIAIRAARCAELWPLVEMVRDSLDQSERELRIGLDAALLRFAHYDLDLHAAHPGQAARFGGLTGATAAERHALSGLAYWRAAAGATRSEIEQRLHWQGDGPAVLAELAAAQALSMVESFAASLRWLDALVAEGRRTGDVPLLVNGLAYRGIALCTKGRLLEAEGDLREAAELAGRAPLASAIQAHLGGVLAEQGRMGEADTIADAVDSQSRPPGFLPWVSRLDPLGRLDLAAGRRERALYRFEEARRLLEPAGIRTPWLVAWRTGIASARAATGSEEARRLALEEADFCSTVPAPRGQGLAMLAAALVSPRPDIDELKASVDVLREAGDPLSLAKALLALGATLRRNKAAKRAREPLAEALDLATRAGASGVAADAREEMSAAGLHPRRDLRWGLEALTPSELRVARLAADGLSNNEIAQTLFVTRKTVEHHLSSIYRKLDIASREALPDALAD